MSQARSTITATIKSLLVKIDFLKGLDMLKEREVTMNWKLVT
jgi:hypothetical protein